MSAIKVRLLERAWLAFHLRCIPTAGPEQIAGMKEAFFAGATVLFTIMTKGVSDGDDVSLADMQLMAAIDAELREFGSSFDRKHLGGDNATH